MKRKMVDVFGPCLAQASSMLANDFMQLIDALKSNDDLRNKTGLSMDCLLLFDDEDLASKYEEQLLNAG